MVDKIHHIAPEANRVHESQDREGRGKREEEDLESEQKEKDQFDRSRPSLKRLVKPTASGGRQGRFPPLGAGDVIPSLLAQSEMDEPMEVTSDTVSGTKALMLNLGILNTEGRIRPSVTIAYLLVTSVLLGSLITMVGVLWR